MNDPPRLLDRGDGFAANLLRAGCDERPSSERTRRTLMALGVTTVVGSAAAGEAAGAGAGALVSGLAGSTAAKVGASSITLAFAAKWVVIGGIGGLVTVGAATEFSGPRASAPSAITAIVPMSLPPITSQKLQGSHQEIAPPSVASDDRTEEVVSPPRAAPAARMHNTAADRVATDTEANAGNGPSRRELPPSYPAPAVPSEPRAQPAFASAPEAAPLTGRASPLPRSTPSTAQAPSTDDERDVPHLDSRELSLRLNSQVTLIDGAWAAVKRNDPAGALRELASYERTFPTLDLHPEVMFLRMSAEAALGRMVSARAEASRLVALYPRSVQAKRARELLARP